MDFHFHIPIPSWEEAKWLIAGVLIGGLMMAIMFHQYEKKLIANHRERVRRLHEQIDQQSKNPETSES